MFPVIFLSTFKVKAKGHGFEIRMTCYIIVRLCLVCYETIAQNQVISKANM